MSTTVNFDTLNHDAWTGHLTVAVLDNDTTPNRVLDMTEPWHIKVRWSLTNEDPLAPLTMVTDGHWRVEAFLEAIGTTANAFEGPLSIGQPSHPLYWEEPWSTGGTASYKHWEPILPAILPGTVNQPGIYKVTVMIQYHLPVTNTFTSMVGFAEYPLICFNNP